MSVNKKIAIIGHFGGQENILDGQTIKTKILYNELKNATDWEIVKVNTYYKKHNPIKLVFDTVKALLSVKTVIVLLSGNGMRLYFPVLALFSKLKCLRVYHDLIGGNLDDYVKKYPKFKKYLMSFKSNWVETEGLKLRLATVGVTNCEVIPNFKRLNILTDSQIDCREPYRFCFFARVMKEKGVEDAIETIESINKKAGKVVCELDIYGRIDDGYKYRFKEVMDNTTEAVAYKGVVPYDKSSEALKGYLALLFPTFWQGEGFPGTIVDAFSAGVPVIATDWNCNSEIINDGVNGIIYPKGNIHTLDDAVMKFIGNRANILRMKQNCIETAKKYQPDMYVKHIIDEISNH